MTSVQIKNILKNMGFQKGSKTKIRKIQNERK